MWATNRNSTDLSRSKNTYGFKTEKNAPQHKDLVRFESDIINLISTIEFKQDKSLFQKKLSKDVKDINSRDTILLPADKTSNIYEVSTDTYKKLLRDNVTNEYEIAPDDLESNINLEARHISEKLQLDERVEIMTRKMHTSRLRTINQILKIIPNVG